MEGILSVKLSADITVNKIFILSIIFQPTKSSQPLRKEFPFFFYYHCRKLKHCQQHFHSREHSYVRHRLYEAAPL